MENRCRYCGKVIDNKWAKVYCSELCRFKGGNNNRHKKKKRNRIYEEQPCWTCKNACGGCNWSRSFMPVKGWKAEKSKLRLENKQYTDTYKIIYCPEYRHLREELYNEENI